MGKRRARPSPYTPPVVREEDVLLYKSSKESEAIRKSLDLSPEQEKRLANIESQETAKQDRFAKKLTTRADVIAILAMWQKQFLLPIGSQLDALNAYVNFLELPFYRRWWIKTVRLAIHIKEFVSRLRFVKTNKGDEDGRAERETEGGTGESGAERGGGETEADEIRYPSEDGGGEDR